MTAAHTPRSWAGPTTALPPQDGGPPCISTPSGYPNFKSPTMPDLPTRRPLGNRDPLSRETGSGQWAPGGLSSSHRPAWGRPGAEPGGPGGPPLETAKCKGGPGPGGQVLGGPPRPVRAAGAGTPAPAHAPLAL